MKVGELKPGDRIQVTTKRVWWFFPPDYFSGKTGEVLSTFKKKGTEDEIASVKIDGMENPFWFRIQDLKKLKKNK